MHHTITRCRALLLPLLIVGSSICVAELSAESLIKAKTLADGTLYADQVARQIGDLITIQVIEETEVTEDQSTETGRDNSTAVSGTYKMPGHGEDQNIPAVGISSSKEFKGDGKYSQKGEVKATLTGRITDVLDNGNLVFEARRMIKINEDIKVIVVSGVLRSADINPDNIIYSEKVHNFQVGIEGEGPISRAQQKGILAKLFDIIWPF